MSRTQAVAEIPLVLLVLNLEFMARYANPKEGEISFLCSRILFKLYALIEREVFRSQVRGLVLRMEGGPMYSLTIREILRKFHRLDIGLYSVVGAMEPGQLPYETTVGRYSSIYHTVRGFSGNHPMNTKSTHAFFYNPLLGKVKTDIISRKKLVIGNDVWIGHNAIILPTVEKIGDGAVIGAGAVVAAEVPPYAVVTGYPARIVRKRFSENKIKELLGSRWWLKTIDELSEHIEDFRIPLDGDKLIR